jgi:hypothetical protein
MLRTGLLLLRHPTDRDKSKASMAAEPVTVAMDPNRWPCCAGKRRLERGFLIQLVLPHRAATTFLLMCRNNAPVVLLLQMQNQSSRLALFVGWGTGRSMG